MATSLQSRQMCYILGAANFVDSSRRVGASGRSFVVATCVNAQSTSQMNLPELGCLLVIGSLSLILPVSSLNLGDISARRVSHSASLQVEAIMPCLMSHDILQLDVLEGEEAKRASSESALGCNPAASSEDSSSTS